jgi:hypothetical protein
MSYWIESHQALGQHPKTILLAQLLKCKLPTAVGYLHFLWWWALEYAPDGSIGRVPAAVIAYACHWSGEPRRFLDALRQAGFIDSDGEAIHDWREYTGRFYEQRAMRRESNRQAQARRREKLLTSANGHADSALTSALGQHESSPNQPNLTGPNLTGPTGYPPPVVPPDEMMTSSHVTADTDKPSVRQRPPSYRRPPPKSER